MNLKKIKRLFLFICILHIIKVLGYNTLQSCSDCINNVNLTPCVVNSYCINSLSFIQIIGNDKLPGATKFGKNDSGNFFFDASYMLIERDTGSPTTIDSIYTCNSSGCTPFTDTTFHSFINSKASDLSCIYNNFNGKCGAGEPNKSYYDTTSQKVINCINNNKCSLTSASGYYIDSGSDDPSTNKITYLITCANSICKTNNDHNGKEYYINAGLDKTAKPIIYFDGDSFNTISGNTVGAFLDSATKSSSYYKNVIVCQTTIKCSSVSFDSGILLNAGFSQANDPQLIECKSSGCEEKLVTGEMHGDYADYIYFIDELTKKLIQCDLINASSSNPCIISNKNTSNKFYLDYAAYSLSPKCNDTTHVFTNIEDDTTFCSVNIISCDSSSTCTSKFISSESQFIDGEKSDLLIVCMTVDDDFFCTHHLAEYLSYYYINNGNTSEYPLIYCGEDDNTKACSVKKASTSGYYITDVGDYMKTYMDNVGSLIKCSSPTICERLSDKANNGYYINAGVGTTNNPLILYDADTPEITEKNPDDKDTYYLDSSSLGITTYANLIYCSTIKNCTSIDPADGYFLNAGVIDRDLDAIIECDKAGCEIVKKVQTCTVDEATTLKPGNYCYQKLINNGNDLNLVLKEFTINSEDIESSNQNITYATSNPIYYYVTVNTGNFPGISTSISTLFEITPKSITRVNADGVYIINSRNEKVDSINGSINVGSSTYTIYSCSSDTQLCTPSQSCTSNTYILDEENGKGYGCSGTSLSPIVEAGYYVDSSYVTGKSLTPAVIKCQGNGNCERFKPTNAYFLNAGSDNVTKPLIYCSGNHCSTQEATIGYYKAEFGQSGVISCTSNTSCKLSYLRYNNYLNSGADSNTKPIIACTKGTTCNTKRSSYGYYLVQDNSDVLITCSQGSACEIIKGSIGYYYNAENNDNMSSDVETIIHCEASTYTSNIICNKEKKNEGFYLSGSSNNVLVDCINSKCRTITVDNGIFRSAGSISTSPRSASNKGRDQFSEEEDKNEEDQVIEDNDDELDALIHRVIRFDEEEIEEINNEVEQEETSEIIEMVETTREDEKENTHLEARATTSSTLIICSGGICNELTAEEINAIPICIFNNDVCYLDNSRVNPQSKMITSVLAGEYCTDSSRSTIYFATETIVEYNDVISGVVTNSKSTIKNCIKASSQYASNLFTVGNNIYKVSEGFIMEYHDTGYYFININKNILVNSLEIKEYNKANVLLYKCDGTSCRIMDKPTSDSYYTDVSKRIIKYSIEDEKYSFVNNKRENICVFEENTCTPKYDIEENDFCITAEGYLVVAEEKIRSRETGKCFMSTSINDNVIAFSHNSVLYLLNSNAAKQVVTTGYYFAENNRYRSTEYRLFNTTRSGITLYGCVTKNCKIYEPQPNVYYFDMLTNYLIQKKDSVWISPFEVGYINVSVNPGEEYIYSYTISNNRDLLLTKTTKDGYYYTTDQKMYQCNSGEKVCYEIEDSAYILTVSNELYYCVVDSEGEDTECFKKTCTVGQIYYMDSDYYKCIVGSYFELIRPKTCNFDDVVVINFPLIYSNTFPTNIQRTLSNIAKNNHHVLTEKASRTSIETVQGVFTNCTYNVYNDYASYDPICIANHVKMNQDNEPDICSVKLLGYTYCTVEEGDDPNKCNPSSAIHRFHEHISLWRIGLTFIISTILYFVIY